MFVLLSFSTGVSRGTSVAPIVGCHIARALLGVFQGRIGTGTICWIVEEFVRGGWRRMGGLKSRWFEKLEADKPVRGPDAGGLIRRGAVMSAGCT